MKANGLLLYLLYNSNREQNSKTIYLYSDSILPTFNRSQLVCEVESSSNHKLHPCLQAGMPLKHRNGKKVAM